MFEPISGLEFKENPDSPARAYLEVILHRIEFTKEAEGAWLTAQNKRSGEDPSGIGSSGGGHSRR